MAFKLDFKKLSQTPEEREANLARIEQEHEDTMRAIIAKRTDKIDALMLQLDRLSDWERTFVRDMHYAATTYGICAMLGERLADLSTKQVHRLEVLHAQYCGAPASKPQVGL